MSSTSVDLSQCDREPVHIPGSIQPQGVLLAVDPQRWTVEQASGNAERMLGLAPEDLLDCTVEELFGAEAAAALGGRDLDPEAGQLHAPLRVRAPGGSPRPLLLFGHLHDGVVVLELEDDTYDPDQLVPFYEWLQSAMTRLARSTDLAGLCELAVRQMRTVTGYERVMVYRFGEDWSGRVIAESRTDDQVQSYRGHRFPASDIPAQARELYRRNLLRFVFDTEAAPAPLEPRDNPRTGRPLDLSYAAYRSISPVHITYLQNMGVRASLSVSLVVGGRLWGLIACHHRRALRVPLRLRIACQAVGEAVGSHLNRLAVVEEARQRVRVRDALTELSSDAIGGGFTLDAVRRHADSLLALMEAEVLLARIDGETLALGLPPGSEVPDLSEAAGHLSNGILVTDAFARRLGLSLARWPWLAGAAFLSLGGSDYVCFGRPEQVRTETWAGDPSKPAEESSGGERNLSPRSSFEAWRREVRGRSRPFSRRDSAAAEGIREVLLEHRGLDARRRSEDALRRTHGLIVDVLDRVEAIVHVGEVESGRTLLLNAHAREALGEEAEAVIARLALPPETEERAVDTRDPRTGRWFSCRTGPIEWADGVQGRLLTAVEVSARKEAEQRLHELAVTDELTGAANRREFVDNAEEELRRALRYGRPLSLLMLDIDHFKDVNDRHGHQVGDRVLRAFASVCRSQLRAPDLFGRLGGEEFAVLLPETAPDAAQAAAERIRAAVAAAEIATEAGPVRVTVSIGVTGRRNAGEDVDSMLKRADDALYAAKEGGRDRVVTSAGDEGGR